MTKKSKGLNSGAKLKRRRCKYRWKDPWYKRRVLKLKKNIPDAEIGGGQVMLYLYSLSVVDKGKGVVTLILIEICKIVIDGRQYLRIRT